MFILRPTANLAKKMKVKLSDTDQKSNTLLGDWFAQEITLDRKKFVLCVSSTSRLMVLVKAAPYQTFPERISVEMALLLELLDIPEPKIVDELSKMKTHVLAKTNSKSILGSMNDYLRNIKFTATREEIDIENPILISRHYLDYLILAAPIPDIEDAVKTAFSEPTRPYPRKKLPVKMKAESNPTLYLVKK